MPDGQSMMDKICYPAKEEDNITSILIGNKMLNLYRQETLDIS